MIAIKLSTKSRYGIHAMIDLAYTYGEGPQAARAIAERQDVPEAYLEQLLVPLRRAGVVESSRGASGGYILAKPAEDIKVADIITALDGDAMLVECLGDASSCARSGTCAPRVLWHRLNDAIVSVLNDTTLRDLINENVSEVN